MSMANSLMTAQDVASALKVSPRTVRRLKDNGLLPSVKVGGQVRFYPKDVQLYLDQNRHW